MAFFLRKQNLLRDGGIIGRGHHRLPVVLLIEPVGIGLLLIFLQLGHMAGDPLLLGPGLGLQVFEYRIPRRTRLQLRFRERFRAWLRDRFRLRQFLQQTAEIQILRQGFRLLGQILRQVIGIDQPMNITEQIIQLRIISFFIHWNTLHVA